MGNNNSSHLLIGCRVPGTGRSILLSFFFVGRSGPSSAWQAWFKLPLWEYAQIQYLMGGGGVSCTCALQCWQEWSTSGRDWFSDRPEGQSKVHSSCFYFFSICLAVSNGERPRPNLMRFCTSFPPNHNTFPPFLPRVTIRWDNCISCFLIATHRS